MRMARTGVYGKHKQSVRDIVWRSMNCRVVHSLALFLIRTCQVYGCNNDHTLSRGRVYEAVFYEANKVGRNISGSCGTGEVGAR